MNEPVTPVTKTDADAFAPFLGVLLRMLQDRGMSPDTVHRLATSEGQPTLKKMLDLAYADWNRAQLQFATEQAAAKAYLATRGTPPSEGIITVPDIDAASLVKLVQRELGIDDVHTHYNLPDWDFYRQRLHPSREISGRGKRFRWRLWKPEELRQGERILCRNVQRLHAQKNTYGHTGAFLEWVRIYKPAGDYASIPRDEETISTRRSCDSMHLPHTGYPHCAAFSSQPGKDVLTLLNVEAHVDGSCAFVLFEELYE